MNKLFVNSYLFFIIQAGKLIAWDYKNHQQFELNEKYLNRLLQISGGEYSPHELDGDLLENNMLLNQEETGEWHWDPLSKIFHFGTQIEERDLFDCHVDNDVFAKNYMQLSENTFNTSPSLFIEKVGDKVNLPPPDVSLLTKIDLLSVLIKRMTCRTFFDESISLEELSTLMYVTFGNFHSEQKEYDELSLERIGLRKTSPSAGGLHASEAYLLVRSVRGLEPGVYHYEAHQHRLTLVNKDNLSLDIKKIFCGQYYMENISFGVFITSRFEKLWHKYPHSRAYRVALLDIGHLSQTFQLVATALNLNPWLSGAFVDDEVAKLLKLEELSEQPLFFVAAGKGLWSSLDPITKKLALGAESR